jgi:hypothetical protein
MLADFANVVNLPDNGEVVLIGESAIQPKPKPFTEWVEVDGVFYIVCDVQGRVESELNKESVYFER